MKSRQLLLAGAAALLLVAAGFALAVVVMAPASPGAAVASPSDATPATAPAQTTAPASRGSEVSAELQQAEAANRELRERVQTLEELVAAARLAQPGAKHVVIGPRNLAPEPELPAPLPFPTGVRHAYTPKGFEEIALRAAEECGLGLEVVAIDCSEYPCVSWTRADHAEDRIFSMSDCAPWTDAFSDATSVMGGNSLEEMIDGKPARYIGWLPAPADPADHRASLRRMRERSRHMREALGLK